MTRALAACLLIACTQPATSSVGEPLLGGDVCAIYATAGTCGSDAACMWLGTGCASADGSDAGPPSCACPDDGDAVCVAENGEPITCVTPAAGSTDPCTRLSGLTCEASSTIAGLCVCE